MALFAIADPHLGHGVDKPMHVFGPQWHDHDRLLAERWQAEVGEKDTVLIPGDISWAMHLSDAIPDLRFLHSLPGTKLLLRGNHDYWWSSLAKMKALCVKEGLTSLHFLRHEAIMVPPSDLVCGTRGWMMPEDPEFKAADRKIYEREIGRLQLSLQSAIRQRRPGQRLIVAMHYPPFSPARKSDDFVRLMQAHQVDACLFGHVHDGQNRYPAFQCIDGIEYRLVAADAIGFKPLRL